MIVKLLFIKVFYDDKIGTNVQLDDAVLDEIALPVNGMYCVIFICYVRHI